MTNKTAKFIKRLKGFNGDARLYKLSEAVEWTDYANDEGCEEQTHETEYVVVSAVIAMFTGPETYIFPADENGKILGWGELPGSCRGSLSHEDVLENAGFEVE